ncbi:MAG: hypothetical protein AB7I04_25390 [Pseudomonadales bacterium]
MTAVCIAFKAHMGWLNAVAVAMSSSKPRPLRVERVDLFKGQGREVVEPYHVAGGWDGLERVPPPPDPGKVVAAGRKRQMAATKKNLRAFRKSLEAEALDWQRAVVLIGRGWLGHTLDEILAHHSHIHVYEGEAVRDATRAALDAIGIPWVEQDEKSVTALAAEALRVRDADAFMKPLRPDGVRSWTKEERLVGLAAWMRRST